jgi:hypothetical protein
VSPEKLVRLQVYINTQELVLHWQSCSWTAGIQYTQVALAPSVPIIKTLMRVKLTLKGRLSSVQVVSVSEPSWELESLQPGNMVTSCALGSNGTAGVCMQSVRISSENCQNSGLICSGRQTIGQGAKACVAYLVGEKKPLRWTLGTFTHKANATNACSAPGSINIGKSLGGFRVSSWGREVQLHRSAGVLRKVKYKIRSGDFIFFSDSFSAYFDCLQPFVIFSLFLSGTLSAGVPKCDPGYVIVVLWWLAGA